MTASSEGGARALATALTRAPLVREAAPLRQEMIRRLRVAILAREYRPGERLTEKPLCERFGVSRTVVREALRQLEAEGLVSMVPNQGPVVAVLSRQDAVALFEVRAALEALAAELFAARASVAERERLQWAVRTVEAAFDKADLAEWLSAKDEYYEALFAGAHNEVIRGTVRGLHARVQMLRGLSLQSSGRQPQTLAEITRITEAAVAGDGAAAGEAARYHVEQAAAVALEQLARGSRIGQGEDG